MTSISNFEQYRPDFRRNRWQTKAPGWVLALIVGAFLAPQSASAKASLQGTATVVTGDMLDVNGSRLQLWGIKAPPLDAVCHLPTKSIPCGHISKTALMDLTAAATVSCRRIDPTETTPKTTSDNPNAVSLARCSSGGFDLSRNMLHTGWALATPTAPASFKETEQAAKKAGRGLWRGGYEVPNSWRIKN